MTRAEASRSLDSSPGKVYGFVAEPRNLAQWVDGVVRASGDGDAWDVTLRVGRAERDVRLRVGHRAPGALLALAGEVDGRALAVDVALAPTTEGGTRVLLALDLHGGGVLARLALRRRVKRSLRGLARVINR